ncbi:sigma-70 family RNA polymerase sigma factor [Candidatus Endoriftia persephonae]|jgi:RNA polymerase sigma-70 factor (ECF subfamily)|uniref:RNA polymerase, sigma-24 subunit, ECF subfamily n=3 Tax=Gammaproteobacteria TaxID=1236 RepID=G2FJ53_9GAMM|nr:sigma-70 family RNA polymerase sigma factor [Candidatus Endoriftia persephone]EGW53146.1 RNA polymerase, sigma-24 subunit, ECF subfamily [endosymbiont of Tevnia jerichonana (vent Tica)]USF89072.1 sigma-70 family RNA polymerase sigma factor [Candidatus Endoriftia persephone]
MMQDPSDENLMQRYCAGDTAAFDALYARYRRPLFRYLQRQGGDASSSEELYQDIWLRVIDARNQWRSEQGFSPWFYRIAHNRLVDHWRSRRPAESFESTDEVVTLDQRWPDGWLLIRQCVERLFTLLGGLSETQRSAFLLKEEAGLSLQQIAIVTGTGRETVKSRLRYALRRLRAGLEGCDEYA